nr:ribonuclease H-like domain-containing protein [Tanacetum cinerariifolium]
AVKGNGDTVVKATAGNKAYLIDYQEFKGGSIVFRGSNRRITGKEKIKAGKLDFEDVYYVEELKHYNLFSVSQMCDKKNKVLFTDIDCLVLSPDFKLLDKNQVLLKILRQHNMYSFNLKNIDPSGDLACLFAKALIDESNKWHKWIGHVNLKNLNKLVKQNLVRGLPSKIFENDHTCVACKKGKKHKASCKAKTVKTIRSDNGTEFKNNELIELCGLKGIKREYSNARTPQENRVAEIKNMTLIKATRTMLADSFLPTAFWAEAVNTACYVLNRVLVTKPQNKTPYELLTGKQPIISYIRPFGCHVTILNTIDQLGKFDGKSNSGFLVRYSLNSKAFRVYNLETKRVEENLHKIKLTNLQVQKKLTIVHVHKLIKVPIQKKLIFMKNILYCLYDLVTQLLSRAQETRLKRTLLSRHVRSHTPLSAAGPSRAFNDGELSYLDDHLMPHLEDIYASPSKCIFTDSSYDDEDSAFLYGTVDEEVYVTQPPSFVDPKFPNKVYKVMKVLYGLRQAPRAWYATLSTFLDQSGYRRRAIDKTLFIKQDKKDIMLVQVYVDAIIFGSIKKSCVKTASTPIETQKPLVKDEEDADVDVHLYRFQVTPKTLHLQVMKRIFRYLKGQPKLGLWYPKVSSFDLKVYSDSYYASANLDRKSTTKGCQFLGRRLIPWQCKKQTIVATSTIEAKYVAAAHCYGQVL